ncbi:MAG: metalloprotease PmbA [Aeromonas molluscorum]|jgi:PmbA protein|uniref:metalloprotease PmbA n=1 Tax=Aeromonas molluscorum TaxID=271417 RepID=UPI003CB2ACDF
MTQQDEIRQDQTQLEAVVAEALEIAKGLGASLAEVSISKQTGLSVNTRGCELESIEFNKDGALGIAVYRNGCKGSSSTTDLSKSAIRAAVEAAIEIARHTSADDCAGLAEPELLAWDAPDLQLCHPIELDPQRGIALAIECERLALNRDSRIKHSDGAGFSSHLGIKVYGNSHGFVKGYAASRNSLSCMLIGEQDGDMQRDYGYSSSRDLAGLWSPQRIADEAVERTVARLGARKITTRHAPVLFHPDTAAGLWGHLVMAISGGNLYRKSSFLQGRLGEQILPAWLRIQEFPHLLGGLASSPFDGEGVRTQDRDIIRDGSLMSWLLTSYSARKLGLTTTGHAGGIHNWQVSNTGQDFQTLLKEMGTGLLVTELMGQGVNIVNGDYSRGAAGFWVENGEIAYPVEEITIAGNLNDMYRQIVAVGTDEDERSSLKTGSVLVENMKLAGH